MRSSSQLVLREQLEQRLSIDRRRGGRRSPFQVSHGTAGSMGQKFLDIKPCKVHSVM